MILWLIGLAGAGLFVWALGAQFAPMRWRIAAGLVGGLVLAVGIATHPASLFEGDDCGAGGYTYAC